MLTSSPADEKHPCSTATPNWAGFDGCSTPSRVAVWPSVGTAYSMAAVTHTDIDHIVGEWIESQGDEMPQMTDVQSSLSFPVLVMYSRYWNRSGIWQAVMDGEMTISLSPSGSKVCFVPPFQ